MKVLNAVLLFVCALSLAQLARAGERKEDVVKRGDTLGQIVYTLRAEGIDASRLEEWNPTLGTRITPGERIVYYTPNIAPPPASQAEMHREATRIIQALQKREAAPRQQLPFKWVVATGMGVAFLGIFVWWVCFDRRTQGRETVNSPLLAKDEHWRIMSEPLIDPDIPTMEKFSELTGKHRFKVVLRYDDHTLTGEVKLYPGAKPLVIFDPTAFCNDARPVGWDKRMQRAQKALGITQKQYPGASKNNIQHLRN